MPYTDQSVGYQNTDTSRAAAEDIGTKAATIREMVIDSLHKSVLPLTTEEIAVAIRLPYRTVQPRLSELRAAGRVKDSGLRKRGTFGKNIIAWSLA